MKAIGGYFELELPFHKEYHCDAIALNTGRNCLEYILCVRNYSHVYLPYYTCSSILEPFKKLGVSYSFYHINIKLELELLPKLKTGEALLYTNYFGIKQEYVSYLASIYGDQLIVDNTQAFFSKPIPSIGTFYSCRKFFGVPDGAYLYCDKELDVKLEQDESWVRMNHLLKRIDLSPEEGYAEFKSNDKSLENQPIKIMSQLTRRIMQSIDYNGVAKCRQNNYKILCDTLNSTNEIDLSFFNDTVPMAYPYLVKDENLRLRLIQNKIFVAQYWPNVLQWVKEDSKEYYFTTHLLPLPIDQRYGKEDIKRLLFVTNNIYKI